MSFETKGAVVAELEQYIENDADLYRQQHAPILKNLAAKKARGDYKHDLAVKLFGYLVEAGAKKYAKEFDTAPGQPWHKLFDMTTRRAVAENLTKAFEVEYDLGNYSHLLPKKYRAESSPAVKGRKKSATQLNREIAEALAKREK